jgi:hypothetical protein
VSLISEGKRYTADRVRFAIDDSTDFSALEPQVRALADAAPEVKSRLNTTMSARSTAPDVSEAAEQQSKGKKDDRAKGKKDGGKGSKRRESGAGDGGRKKQKV